MNRQNQTEDYKSKLAYKANDKNKRINEADRKARAQKKLEAQKKNRKPKFYRNNGTVDALFNGAYFSYTLMYIAVIINTVMRFVVGDWGFAVPNFVFLILSLIAFSYINPIDFSSDKEEYRMPEMNKLYRNLKSLTELLLTRLGENLQLRPGSSLTVSTSIAVISWLMSTLFYNSSFVMWSIPFLLIFVARVFAGNEMKNFSGTIARHKWILTLIVLINAGTTVYFRTAMDFNLLILVSLYNLVHVWFRTTEIYR